jgi:hypothetical protein
VALPQPGEAVLMSVPLDSGQLSIKGAYDDIGRARQVGRREIADQEHRVARRMGGQNRHRITRAAPDARMDDGI